MSTVENPGSAAGAGPEATSTRVVDVDVHEGYTSVRDLVPYLPDKWKKFITEYRWNGPPNPLPYGVPSPGGGTRMDWVPPEGTPMGSDIDALRRQLFDGEGVSVAILNGDFRISTLQGWYEFAVAAASAYNDWQIAHWLEPEPRLRGSIHVVAHDPASAAREIDRLGGHPQIAQVFLPAVNDREYGDPRYRPIFEAAVRNNLPVTLHHSGFTRTAIGYPRYFMEWHVAAIPQTMMCQMASLICNGVFDALPTLKVVMLETGITWIPHFMWRMDLHYRELRSEIPWVKRLPSEILRESLAVGTQPIEDLTKAEFMQLLDQMGTDRMLMFATDYPHWDADSPTRGLPPGVPDEIRHNILSGNADRVFSLT
ncbi:hypothetical protein DSM104299_02065 [Baekduia alba]|uniref:amidohydrolase family protein n=1 Tax=Baekduia alba TaxID=2997333 RepID=UPI0023425B5A|nr:amidohydrolase family protein [Baekduia alba]WCB93352.1 hypothetical protein DSM104299_02065 [Baekduia alba]